MFNTLSWLQKAVNFLDDKITVPQTDTKVSIPFFIDVGRSIIINTACFAIFQPVNYKLNSLNTLTSTIKVNQFVDNLHYGMHSGAQLGCFYSVSRLLSSHISQKINEKEFRKTDYALLGSLLLAYGLSKKKHKKTQLVSALCLYDHDTQLIKPLIKNCFNKSVALVKKFSTDENIVIDF